MGGSKRLIDEPNVCGECGADMEEEDDGEFVCSADCPNSSMDRYDRMAGNRIVRGQGWDAYHDGVHVGDPPFSGAAAEAWERGWRLAERGAERP